MNLILSYGTKIRSECSAMDTMLLQTAAVYTEMLSFIADVCRKEEHIYDKKGGGMNAINVLEPMIHKTKDNPDTLYDFDERFPNCPSYLRRAAIARAYGAVSSWRSNLANWAKDGKHGKEPAFPMFSMEMPGFYYGNMFYFTDENGNRLSDGSLSVYAKIKVFCSQRQLIQDHRMTEKTRKRVKSGNLDLSAFVWDWMPVRLKKSDIRYLQRRKESGCEICTPVLVRCGPHFELRFAVKNDTMLTDAEIFDTRILAVDLGINTPATCVVMESGGTILARRFYKAPKDTGCLDHRTAMVSRAQSNGSRKTPVLWRMAANANRKLSDGTADFIISLAEEFKVDVIVFEHLNVRGRKGGGRKRRLHHWRASYVQELVTNRAHARGMGVAHICAWNTSRLAYDGSGRVTRGIDNHYSVCRFTTGKVYNCDLSAAYNIGAATLSGRS